MAVSLRRSLLLLSILYSITNSTVAHLHNKPGVILRDASNTPSLTAITVRSPIQKRRENFHPKHQCELHYVDHSSILSGGSSRFAKTSMKYKWPTLLLEDIEMNTEEIQCSESAIVLQFNDQLIFNFTREAWGGLSEFLMITSHPGCNRDGERAPYLVSGITYRAESMVTVLFVKPIFWKDAYETMTVKFGASKGQYQPDSLRIHDSLRRRQLVPSSVVYPPAPSTALTADVSVETIAYKSEDEEIFTLSKTNGPVTESITMTCKDCSIDGIIEITDGEFTVSAEDEDDISFKAKDFIDYGYFKAVVNGFKAHVELTTDLSLSTTQEFDKTLAQISLPGFQIPGIALVGPSFEPHIKGSIEIKAELGFTYGFDLTIPDNSSVVLNIGSLNESSSNGFSNADITAIPLSASSPSITLTLTIGLIPELLLGINILSGAGHVDAGFFLDLPNLSVSVSQLTGVNAECKRIADSDTVDEFLSHIFPNLTHVVPKVEVGVGLQVGARLDVAEVGIFESIGTATTLTGTEWTLSTACLSWDGEKKALVTPAVTTAAEGSEATGGSGGSGDGSKQEGGKSNIGARGRDNLMAGGSAVWWSAGMLLGVPFVALSL